MNKQEEYKDKCIEMLKYIKNKQNKQTIYINKANKIEQFDKFINTHRLAIENYPVFSKIWNTYANRIKIVFDKVKQQ